MAGFNLEKTAVGGSTASPAGSTTALGFEISPGQCRTASSAARETLCETSATVPLPPVAVPLMGLMSPPLGWQCHQHYRPGGAL